MDMFDRTISALSKALDMMSLRHQVIASNIANQDTPNYKARDVQFKEALEQALQAQSPMPDYKTHPRHMALSDSDASVTDGGIVTRPDGGAGYDGNSVNVEMEMASMAENTIAYNAAAQIISNKFRALSNAIREGK